MKKINLFIALLLILTGTALLWSQEVVESIVAVVNDDIITLSDYKAQHQALYEMMQNQFEGEEFQERYRQLRKELLDTMITDILLRQEAERRGYNVAEQVKMAIENIKQENGINSDEELRRLMQQQGIDFEQWKKQMEKNFLRQSIVVAEVDRSIVMDDSEIVSYYKQHPDEFTEPREYKLRAIYISAADKSQEEVEETKRVIEEKLAAEEDFASLAGTYSEGPEKESQGDLGTFKKGELEESLEQAVDKLEVGETTPWLKVKEGWYLLKLEGVKERRLKSFDEVRKQIEEKLYSQKREKRLDEFLKELKEKSYIKIIDPNPLHFD